MNIWIIDDDFSHAYDLKQEIQYRCAKLEIKSRFNVYHQWKDLQDTLAELKKKSLQKPSLIIMECELENDWTFSLVDDLKATVIAPDGKFIFCSAISFGRFKNHMASEYWPFFFIKQFDRKKMLETISRLIHEIQQTHLPQKEWSGKTRRLAKELAGLLKELREMYYAAPLHEPLSSKISEKVERVYQLSSTLDEKSIAKQAQGFLKISQTRGILPQRVKREMKELVLTGEKFLEAVKGMSGIAP